MAESGERQTRVAGYQKVPSLCSQRWNLAAISFFGLLYVYVVRVNLSVAIICMVSHPTSNDIGQHGFNTSGDGSNTIVAVTSSERPRGHVSGLWYELRDLAYLTSSGAPLGVHVGEVEHLTTTGVPLGEQVGSDDDSGCRLSMRNESSLVSQSGEFLWDKTTISRLLAMYFYGYIFTQIPGGWLAGRFGGRRVWAVCQVISALCTLLTPLASRSNVYLAYALRFLLGLAAGVAFPCVHAMLGRWAPKLERTKLVAFSFSGAPIGTITTFAFSGLLCVYGFDNGWGSIFYLSGAGNLAWVVFWLLITADTPSQHRRIRPNELNYILNSIGEKPNSKAKIPTPWRAMMTSGPLWAVISAHAFNNYTNYTLLTSLPTFMKEVLKFDISQNGGLSALPYVCEAVVSLTTSHLADYLRQRGILSTKSTRKIFQVTCMGYCYLACCIPLNIHLYQDLPKDVLYVFAFLGAAVCIGTAGYMKCEHRHLAVFLFCLCLSFMGCNRSGYAVNHIDLAPRHAGVLFGITNTAATIPGMIAPLVVGALTPNRTPEEWRRVFFVCSGMATLGAIVYAILADGELQSWASPPAEEIIIDLDRSNKLRHGEKLSDPVSDSQSLDGSEARTGWINILGK